VTQDIVKFEANIDSAGQGGAAGVARSRGERFALNFRDGGDRGERREGHVSHLSPPAQKPDRFAALEDIQQQPQRLSPRAFEAGIFVDDFARFVARQVQ
jgi:hypothetical protein